MNWYGLDWLGLFLSIVGFALVPGVVASYGGHLAAESVEDPKRRWRIKLCFWLLFLFGFIATSCQLFRAAIADLDKQTKDTFSETLAISKFPPPPPPINIAKTVNSPRSYVSIDSSGSFPEKKYSNGQLIADQHLQVGEHLGFNLHLTSIGPNPVELLQIARWLYVVPSDNDETQKTLIEDFKKKLIAEAKKPQTPEDVSTIMPGESRFLTAFASKDDASFWLVTLQDLENFRSGTEFNFAIVQITYRDNSLVHHARRCVYLQPPADPPGIWHFCNSFNNAD